MAKNTATEPSLTIVIPTLNAGADLTATLDALGSLKPKFTVIVVDADSEDETVKIAKDYGARVIDSRPGRGSQLMAGADSAMTDWLLFLHADTRLEDDWFNVIQTFMTHPNNADRAGYGRFRLNGPRTALKEWMERGVAWRSRALGWPFGDQGLLIRAGFYRSLGGYRAMDLFEDVDLVRAIGKDRLRPLPIVAETSSARYEQDGYLQRIAKNISLQVLYRLGCSPERLAKLYS